MQELPWSSETVTLKASQREQQDLAEIPRISCESLISRAISLFQPACTFQRHAKPDACPVYCLNDQTQIRSIRVSNTNTASNVSNGTNP
jgi:hypothetical protein